MAELQHATIRIRGFADAEMDHQLLRSLGAGEYGGASLGECLALAARLPGATLAQWVDGFASLADRNAADGRRRLAAGHKISARDQLLKAAGYYRAAEYYAESGSSRRRELGLASRAAFGEAIRAGGWKITELEMPFGERRFPGYFISAARVAKPRPTLVAMSGFDGTSEELFFAIGRAALERNYNVLLFDGPGQIGARRFDEELFFVPDYEAAIRAVVDAALARPEVDPSRLGLYGLSLGGYFVLRGAAHEPRLGAVVANSPVIDIHAYLTAVAGADPLEMAEDVAPADLAGIPDDILSPHHKWGIINLCHRYGKASLKEVFAYLKQFRLSREELHAIACPALGLTGDSEGSEALRQAQAFAEGAEGELRIFTADEGAGGNCQSGNISLAAAETLDWLDDNLGKTRVRSPLPPADEKPQPEAKEEPQEEAVAVEPETASPGEAIPHKEQLREEPPAIGENAEKPLAEELEDTPPAEGDQAKAEKKPAKRRRRRKTPDKAAKEGSNPGEAVPIDAPAEAAAAKIETKEDGEKKPAKRRPRPRRRKPAATEPQ